MWECWCVGALLDRGTRWCVLDEQVFFRKPLDVKVVRIWRGTAHIGPHTYAQNDCNGEVPDHHRKFTSSLQTEGTHDLNTDILTLLKHTYSHTTRITQTHNNMSTHIWTPQTRINHFQALHINVYDCRRCEIFRSARQAEYTVAFLNENNSDIILILSHILLVFSPLLELHLQIQFRWILTT